MDKKVIGEQLIEKHLAFISKISQLSDEDFERRPGTKWTAGQQLEHIIKSVAPVDMAFGLPSFVLKMKFGLSDRPSKSYEQLVQKYLKVLDDHRDYVLPDRFAPEEIPVKVKDKKLKKLKGLVEKLVSRLKKYSEDELDQYILPHPVMGKLTLREMLYFTLYHVQHHDKQILPNLKAVKDAES